MNRIVYGNLEFNHRNLVSGTCNLQHAMNGESLAIDTLIFKAWTGQEPEEFILLNEDPFYTVDDLRFTVLTNKVDPTNLSIGTPLMYYFDNELIGKFFIDKINRNSNNTYIFSCISAVGILERNMHYGGIYTGQIVKTVLQDLLTGIDYELDNSLEDLRLYGYLPYDTKRNNLMQIQVATGLAVKTMPDGKLLITALSKDVKSNIGADKVVIGGKYDRLVPASKVVLTEHKYEESAVEDVIYTNDINGSVTVIFKEPMHSLSITGGAITASGANYAILNGVGSVELKGKKYNHITQTIEKGLGNENVITVDKATLVTLVNSNDVLNRLFYTYTLNNMIEQEIIYNYEKCGDMANIINPYTKETESIFIRTLDINFGGFLKAKGQFVVDFVPSQPTMGYSTRIVLTSGTQWTVPAGVTKVRVILIGGGSGGAGGFNGVNGTPGVKDEDDGGKGGPGGLGGAGGPGGNVLNTTLEVSPEENINYLIGAGGAGGTAETDGAVGEYTIFSSLSSENGNNANEYLQAIDMHR